MKKYPNIEKLLNIFIVEVTPEFVTYKKAFRDAYGFRRYNREKKPRKIFVSIIKVSRKPFPAFNSFREQVRYHRPQEA